MVPERMCRLTIFSQGIAALMALDLGLHKEVKGMPLVEHERRVRVFWNIFVYEKCVFDGTRPCGQIAYLNIPSLSLRTLASEMGRPCVIPMRTCDPVRLSEEQSDEYETVVHHATGAAVRLYVRFHSSHQKWNLC